MSSKREHVGQASSRSLARRRNSEESSLPTSVIKSQSINVPRTSVKKTDRSLIQKHDDAVTSKKLDSRDQQNLAQRPHREVRANSVSKISDDSNSKVTLRKKSPRGVVQKGSRLGDQTKVVGKATSLRRANTQPLTIKDNQLTLQHPSGGGDATSKVGKDTSCNDSAAEEFDPSKLTLAERVELFNQKIARHKALASENIRSRGASTREHWSVARSKTQPVTSDELEAAYKKSSPSRTERHSMYESIDEASLQESKSTVSPSDKDEPRSESKNREISNSPVHKTKSREKLCDSRQLKRSKVITSTSVQNSSYRRVDKISSSTRTTRESTTRAMEKREALSSTRVSPVTRRERSSGKIDPLKPDNHRSLKKKVQTVKSESSHSTSKERTSKISKKQNSLTTTDSQCSDDSESIVPSTKPARSTILRSKNQRVKDEICSSITSSSIGESKLTKLVDEANSLNITNSRSIANRLAALEYNGSTNWKHRAQYEADIFTSTIAYNKDDAVDGNSSQKYSVTRKQGILADRLEKLETASEGWKNRVAATDAVKYSIYGKMKVDHSDGLRSPASSLLIQVAKNESNRQRKIPKADCFRVEKENTKGTTTYKKLGNNTSSHRTVSSKIVNVKKDAASSHFHADLTVAIPQIDDTTFSTFFNSVSADRCLQDCIDLNEADFDLIKSRSEILVPTRKVRTRGRRLLSRNPLRALAARTDLRTEYTEVKTGVAERIMRNLNIERLAKSSTLAVEALAGLASTEDFNAITLRNVASSADNSGTSLTTFKDLMLILVKGRRLAQVRLVEPIASSVNSGDNYILVTPTEIYNYVGKYSNVIERTRGADIASSIQQNKDLGCNANKVITISEEIPTCSRSDVSKFWKHLGVLDGHHDVTDASHPDEDELYERMLINTNMVYELIDEELVPFKRYWGVMPKIEMLDPNKILVFDFGSEMYVWNGKLATLPKRKLAADMAKELWKAGYDYSECTICPLTAVSMIGVRSDSRPVENKAATRPDWCLLVKVTQHMEPVLFKEKFLDWPEFKQVIQVKSNDSKEQVDGSVVIQPFNIDLMIEPNSTPVDLLLEGTHLGRGKEWFDEELRKVYLIATRSTTVWHIDEYSHTLLDSSSAGHFHSGDSYIVRWTYRITVTGNKLSGLPSKYSAIGRDRCAYFIWQGHMASPNEQGTAALLTIELDHEKGPQIQVIQGFEAPAFLNLFSGGMIVHFGKRSSRRSKRSRRLYICRGTLETEVCLVEVPCTYESLRNRCSFLLLDPSEDRLYVWHGGSALPHIRQNARNAAENLRINCPKEAGMSLGSDIEIFEVYEGDDAPDFNEALGITAHKSYSSPSFNMSTHTPRLFHISSISGEFRPTELLCAHRADLTTPYPFLQIELYQVNQPALFILDNEDELWLWQGWWPDTGEEDQTGSGAVRWQSERRAAMTTALEYWQAKHSSSTQLPISMVWAGLEPIEFTNLFPMWEVRRDIAEINSKDGHKPGEVLTLQKELEKLTQSTYPTAELLQRPLPQGVDPTRLELYLSPEDFQDLFSMTRKEFGELPAWKQIKMKKQIGLF